MEGDIKVSPEQLQQASEEFRSAASSIYTITQDMINKQI